MLKAWGGRDGEMELGGVGNMPDCFLVGRDLAATVAKLSRPVQKLPSRGVGKSTDAVMPAKAMAMLEVFWMIGAMSGIYREVDVSL